ncbi:MAG: hypothetical protein ABFR05_03230 [Bacteroidota bacterium]
MFVNILTFKTNEKGILNTNYLSMFEDNFKEKPKGLDRLHIFKDKKKTNKYYLIEYWKSKDMKDIMESSNNYPYLNRLHKISDEMSFKKIEGDVVI